MDNNVKKNLELAGISVEESIERFSSSEALYEKYLIRFISDDNFNNAIKAVNEDDYENAMIYLHTLKGVAANMGMKKLSVLSDEIVVMIRKGQNEDLFKFIRPLSDEYEHIVCAIKDNLQG